MDKRSKAAEKPRKPQEPVRDKDNSLEAASEETSRFMEQSEAPGHAGVGDAG